MHGRLCARLQRGWEVAGSARARVPWPLAVPLQRAAARFRPHLRGGHPCLQREEGQPVRHDPLHKLEQPVAAILAEEGHEESSLPRNLQAGLESGSGSGLGSGS